MSSEKDFSPMLYDVMRELATQLGGRYVAWMDEATSSADEERWRAEHARVTREVRAVDPDSRQAIETHIAKLRAELTAMPRHAPGSHMSGISSAEQLRSRFERRIVAYLEELRSQTPGIRWWPPVLVYAGGQPGAGKSRATERAAQARPSLVPVSGDDLRQFHPDYPRLMREDPLSMPAATARASGQWISMSAEYLREQRADVLIETTLRSSGAMASTIASFREAGYAVELRVVAVPHEVSRLSTVERYTGQVEATGAGRWTPTTAHDEAYSRAVTTVEDLVASGSVDRFVIENRGGTALFGQSYFGVRDEGLRHASREAGVALEHARSVDQMTPDAAQSWLDYARAQIELVRGLAQKDSDLLATVERIGRIDARAVAARAYPLDPARASAAMDTRSAAAGPHL